MPVWEKTKKRVENIKNWASATIENVNIHALREVFKDPPKKKKRRKLKTNQHHRVDKRLKIWTNPRAHATQRGRFTKWAIKWRKNIEKYMFNLLFKWTLYYLDEKKN